MAAARLPWRALRRISAACLLLAGCPSFRLEYLDVRDGSGFRYQLSQAAGEAELGELSRRASTEDAWLFIRGTWIDIGYEERAAGVLLDPRAVIAAAQDYARAAGIGSSGSAESPIYYHIHPFRLDPSVVDPPSLQDIHALTLVKEECRRILKREAVGVVFDGRGRWSFDVTPDLEARILHDEHALPATPDGASSYGASSYAVSKGYVGSSDSAAMFDRSYPPLSWTAFLPDSSRSREARIRTFIDGVRPLGVIVAYDPRGSAPQQEDGE